MFTLTHNDNCDGPWGILSLCQIPVLNTAIEKQARAEKRYKRHGFTYTYID